MNIFQNKRKGIFYTVFSIFLLMIVISGTIYAGDSLEADKQEITIQSPPTVGALPILWMIENGKLADRADISINISPDHQKATSLIAQGDIEMMVTGVNVGAKVFNRGIDVRLLNTNIWAIDYLLTQGFKAEQWSDLEGKTLSLPLKGGPLDFLARYFLIENGVNPEDVNLVYKPLNSGAKTFQLGNLDSIILPEPQVTISLKNTENAYLSMDLQQEWAKLHQGEDRIPFVGLFVRGDFAVDNSDLVEEFNTYYKEGVEWVHDNPEAAAQLAEEYFNIPAGVVQASFNRINLNIYPEGEAFMLIEMYFNEIMEMYPEMIGGKLPNELFYF
ncbi:MAG: ABC transporter substrate-binding protein [Halanaerobiales bacterium]